MKKVLLLLVVCLLLVLPGHASAQQAVHISKMEIDLWPEYDQPSMLTIYRITLAKDTTLPTNVNFRVPTGSKVNAVAVKDVDTQLLNITYQTETSGAYDILHFQVTLPEFQIEFYDPGLKKDGSQRTFLYQWPGDFVVDQADVLIQQPFDATQTSVIPGPVTTRANTDGMTYYAKSVGSLSAGQSFRLEIGYQKPSDRLSVEFMQVQPSGTLPSQSSTTTTSLTSLWPWLVGGLGVLLIAGGAFWYWRLGRQTSSRPARKRSRASGEEKRAAEIAPETEAEAIYCHQCGRRAAPSDRFCRVCGTRLRIDHA